MSGRSERYATLNEVARELWLSREGVRKIETQALAKCRAELDRRGLTLPPRGRT